MEGEAGRAPSGGLRSCVCSRMGWGRHHHHHDDDEEDDDVDDDNIQVSNTIKLVQMTTLQPRKGDR